MGDKDRFELFRTQDGKLFALNPDKNEYVAVNDVRDKAKAVSDQHPPSNEAKKAFYQQRITLVQASNLADDHKQELLKNLQESLTEVESNGGDGDPPPPEPVPGGVGFGVFYRENKLTFEQSSALFYRIVTVPGIGAELNKWLYLTSTNHSPKGTEAFVSYEKQDNPTFTVFDWSKEQNEQWVLSKRYNELGEYLTVYRADNHQYPTIYVVNSTRRVPGTTTTWINEVMLFNKVSNAYDLIYSNGYDLPEDEEENRKHWGPIVETFPPFPNETNRVGFFNAMVLLDGKQYFLTHDVTDLRIDDREFEVVYFQPNFSFIVH